MNEVRKTLYIPLYGKAAVSRKRMILHDPTAERIWEAERFPIRGKARSKWLSYNMAMRARVFDDWTESMLKQNGDALVLHVGCGLDSRCLRVAAPCANWFDCDFAEVVALRKKYYSETERYHMLPLDASDPEALRALPSGPAAIVVLEGLSMYLTNGQLSRFLRTLHENYPRLHVLLDVYTEFGARASKLKNPVNDLGVTALYGVKDVRVLTEGTGLRLKAEHSFTPERLIEELSPGERTVFRLLFTGSVYRKIYRLYELEGLER